MLEKGKFYSDGKTNRLFLEKGKVGNEIYYCFLMHHSLDKKESFEYAEIPEERVSILGEKVEILEGEKRIYAGIYHKGQNGFSEFKEIYENALEKSVEEQN